MKVMYIIIGVLLLSMIASPILISGEQQPTQQFNKIFLDPFYRESMLDTCHWITRLFYKGERYVISQFSFIIVIACWKLIDSIETKLRACTSVKF